MPLHPRSFSSDRSDFLPMLTRRRLATVAAFAHLETTVIEFSAVDEKTAVATLDAASQAFEHVQCLVAPLTNACRTLMLDHAARNRSCSGHWIALHRSRGQTIGRRSRLLDWSERLVVLLYPTE